MKYSGWKPLITYTLFYGISEGPGHYTFEILRRHLTRRFTRDEDRDLLAGGSSIRGTSSAVTLVPGMVFLLILRLTNTANKQSEDLKGSFLMQIAGPAVDEARKIATVVPSPYFGSSPTLERKNIWNLSNLKSAIRIVLPFRFSLHLHSFVTFFHLTLLRTTNISFLNLIKGLGFTPLLILFNFFLNGAAEGFRGIKA